MKNGKYENKRGRKLVALLLLLVLLLGVSVGGTIAWLVSNPAPVVNTFTVGDIGKLTLAETTGDSYTIVPGENITKNPKVSYDYDQDRTGDFSVPVYIFVEINAPGWDYDDTTNTYSIGDVTWTVDSSWTYVEEGVYYKDVAQDTDLAATSIIAGDTITVPNTIEKDDVDDITTAASTITFTAYAIQQNGFSTPDAAWDEVSN